MEITSELFRKHYPIYKPDFLNLLFPRPRTASEVITLSDPYWDTIPLEKRLTVVFHAPTVPQQVFTEWLLLLIARVMTMSKLEDPRLLAIAPALKSGEVTLDMADDAYACYLTLTNYSGEPGWLSALRFLHVSAERRKYIAEDQVKYADLSSKACAAGTVAWAAAYGTETNRWTAFPLLFRALTCAEEALARHQLIPAWTDYQKIDDKLPQLSDTLPAATTHVLNDLVQALNRDYFPPELAG